MIVIQGTHNTAKVFADIVDQSAINQIKELCDQEFATGSKIRIMPDAHAGAGCTIGTTMTIEDKIVPNLVGVDIGCGMETVALVDKDIDFGLLDRSIRKLIPNGFNIREKALPVADLIAHGLFDLRCAKHVDIERALLSVGTLGGGNHFIEVDRANNGRLFLVVHSGSRHIGLEVAKYYQDKAWACLSKKTIDIAGIIAFLRDEGRSNEIQDEIRRIKEQTEATAVPKHLAYVSDDLFEDYIHDMEIIQRFASINRQAIAGEIIRRLELDRAYNLTTIHNYIDPETMILRKGAVSARKGERLLIPINMRDGSLLCVGLGNDDWNQSAPHGAGRLMSRSEARRSLSLDAFKASMSNVYSTSVGEGTLDEAPMAYKPIDSIMNNIHETVEVVEIIRPVYNFKASGE